MLKGQGAFHSSIRDMAKFLAAHLQLLAESSSTGHSSNTTNGVRRLSDSDSGIVRQLEIPPTLAAAIRAAVVPIGADDADAQHGKVASGWEIYYAAGHNVIWKSGKKSCAPQSPVQTDR